MEYLKKFFVDELIEPCWITIDEKEFEDLIQAFDIDMSKVKSLMESAYKRDRTLEFHIDKNECFHEIVNDLLLRGEI